ncbi:hypothetical protein F6U93_08400 [Tamlana haliotis]|uniref:Uncharacterized protein n=1 Tax=Pseudotamlana haliotis TaxID=2614804 RepID=A0A6N6MCL0_9FLAO|nr:hypothetical protein [Tamlana haliotis]KAB1067952.1 hypothetical protein F6U93_08400 [Tamlana haliotis]
MKQYSIIKPCILNLNNRLKHSPPDFNFNIDYAYWLVSEIIKKTAYKLESDETDIWIPLCSMITKKHPYDYRLHLRYLCENFPVIGNVLFRDSYAVGNCYSYRLNPYFFKEKVEIVNVTDKKLLRFLRAKAVLKSDNAFKKEYNFLGKYFNEKLTIDSEAASRKNTDLYDENLNYKKHLLNAGKITEIANGEFSIKYSERTDGRLHHQLTNLSKELRPFLRYDGKKLVECDLSASIPTILYYILSNINTNDIHMSNVITSNKYYYRHYMFCKTLETPMDKEIALFGEKVISGQFYETFIEGMHTIHNFDKSLKPDEYYLKNVERIFGRPFDGDEDDLRQVVKLNFLSMLNAESGQFLNEEAEFNMLFPSILKWLKQFKKIDHRCFSYLVLQMESYFMLDIVARGFNRKFNGKKLLFTLHDCLITTEDNIDYLYQYMRESLSEVLKFTPVFSVKVWE